MKVQTGSLICLGCGYEHRCGIHGCALIAEAADQLESLNDFTNTQMAVLLKENQDLRNEIAKIKADALTD